MSETKPAAETKDIITTKQTPRKSDKTEIDLWLEDIASAEARKAKVVGEFQRKLQALAVEKKLLEEKGLPIDWSSPDFTTALADLGLTNGADFNKVSVSVSRTKKAKSSVEKDWADTKGGKDILGKFSKGDELSVAEVVKKLGLAENTTKMYLSKGSSTGYLESLREGRYKRVK